MPFDLMNLFIIFFASIFTQNVVLTYFLGICPFVAVSKEIPTAFGMGMAVIFVMVMTMGLNWPIYHLILVPFNVEYLQFLVFIIVIATFVQIVEIFIDRYSPVLYVSLGVFLPLITVNCAILGVSLFAVIRGYSYPQSLSFALGSGIGWTLAIIAMAGIRQKLQFSRIPRGLEGPGITMIIAGIMAMAFMGFAGIISL
ncbi:MAG: NADH:ubiquinone reductase (Na(+)-transporting) subunit E [Candidatus Latescibacteria bacterium]|jgi:Na+-transporting NADH:ubiquinone oxidoreductase subunit E|nr:NADH:ubiquinone reductase (Na(+)-transporting) subunit E [Candidatus Latescibacterota bacterium]